MSKMIPLGDKLRDLRNERNLSQAQLAKRIGVNSSTVALYETGDRLPSLPRLIALSRSLGVTTDYLLGVSREKDCCLDVTGLTQRQIESLEAVIENYRE
ncbi:helix-turn-helix transcriptional regulator [Oscillospiraceae bacterium 38-13]|jgi:transcriptional regulator with XRE-family HTH domain